LAALTNERAPLALGFAPDLAHRLAGSLNPEAVRLCRSWTTSNSSF